MHTAEVKRLKASVTTLGCKSNQYDSSALEDVMRGADLDVVPFPAFADAYIINTCSVTGKTDHQSRQLIRKVRKLNPGAVVIVTGCYAQVSPDEVVRIEGVDYVVGNPQKGAILEYILKGRPAKPEMAVGDWRQGTPLSLRARSSGGRTRANLKVQEGCDRACSYCIIPKARGRSKSVALDDVEREMEILIEAGYREIILTGIHLGAYGSDLSPSEDITSILKLIEKRDLPCRFRISSLDPDEVTDELTDILKTSKRICNHLHLPLQSGDDGVINNMRRPYTASLFRQKAERLFASVPDISVGIDVIAGFPGEGEKEFSNTYSLINSLPLSYLHIFPFSKRRGTPAAERPGQVDPRVIKDRCEVLKELDREKRLSFHRSFLDKKAEVLFEMSRDRETGLLKGRARNYIQVYMDGHDTARNTLAEVILNDYDADGMSAVLAEGR